jgi:hypothetical protein
MRSRPALLRLSKRAHDAGAARQESNPRPAASKMSDPVVTVNPSGSPPVSIQLVTSEKSYLSIPVVPANPVGLPISCPQIREAVRAENCCPFARSRGC